MVYCFCRPMPAKTFKLHQILGMLEEDEPNNSSTIATDVFLSPPDDPTCSDADSGDEDLGGTFDNLTRSQLESEATATVTTYEGRVHTDDISSSESEPEGPTEKKKCAGRKRQVKQPSQRDWIKQDTPTSEQNSENTETFLDYSSTYSSPASLFELFFDSDVMEMISENSVKYARQKGNLTFVVTAQELRLFLAILINSGYAPLPRRRMYWEPSDDVKNIAISNAMSRNRFEEIMQFLHLADNSNLGENDKVAKVRPLLAMLNERFLRYFAGPNIFSIDESMVPYYGRNTMKQYIRGKPIRFGYKMWCMNTPLGYCVQCEPYQGAGVTDAEVGLGGSVILDLISELPGVSCDLYFDNFFTSLKLINMLSSKNIRATGTVRPNRVEKCPLVAPEVLKKQKRGTFDYLYDQSSDVLVTQKHTSNCLRNMEIQFLLLKVKDFMTL